MLELFLKSAISGGCIIVGLYMALNIYFKHINKDCFSASSNLDEETKRRFKAICNMEYRKPIDQENLVITKFVEIYTMEHNIDWEKIKH